jgi:N-methylhydantoinase B
VNISRATAIAACYVALKHLLPDVPANAGVLDAVDFVLPDRLVISTERPRPVGGYTETILRMIDVIFSAAAQADPTRAVAQAYGTINALSIAGSPQRRATRPALGDVLLRRRPWRPRAAMGSHGNAPISTATIPPLEILKPLPVRPGMVAACRSGGDPAIAAARRRLRSNCWRRRRGSSRRARHLAAQGIAGGGPGAVNVFSYENDGAWHTPPMVSKMHGIRLVQGERVRLETPGGGGWGAPDKRSSEKRGQDRAMGYVNNGEATDEKAAR